MEAASKVSSGLPASLAIDIPIQGAAGRHGEAEAPSEWGEALQASALGGGAPGPTLFALCIRIHRCQRFCTLPALGKPAQNKVETLLKS